MKKLFLVSLLACAVTLSAGCASVTPNYDAKFGDAVREAKLKMTINPTAGFNPDMVSGMDGKTARDTIVLYQSSFKTPPPAVNVINIGGAIGGGGSGK